VERTRPTRALTAVTAILSAVLLAGCASGFGATSIKPYAPSDGILANSGDLRVLNILVVSTGPSGVVSASIVNHGGSKDALTGMTSPDGTVDLTGNGRLRPKSAIRLGADTETSATVAGLTKLPGETITLKLTFQRAEPLTIRTVVVPASGEYASITPAPTAEAE
jgi:hypothetical protein